MTQQSPKQAEWSFMKNHFDWRHGTIGELVQKALAGAGHEIVKVRTQIRRFPSRDREPRSVRKLYQSVGSFDAVAIAAGESYLLRFRNSPLKSGVFRWEASHGSDQSGQEAIRSSKKKDPFFGFGRS